MKKISFLIIFLTSLCLQVMAQTNSTKASLTDLNRTSHSAKQWFKDSYLKRKYPDISNYKVLKFSASPVSKQEQIQLEIDKAVQGITENDTIAVGSNYSHYLFLITQEKAAYQKIVADSGAVSATASSHQKKINEYAQLIADTKIRYSKAVLDKTNWNNALKILDPAQAATVAYYQIFINCSWQDAGITQNRNFYFNFGNEGAIGEVRTDQY